MNKRKKTLRQLVVALLLLCTIGLPIQNIVLANELSTTEEVITDEIEANTSNSESAASGTVPTLEEEAKSTVIDESTQTSKETSSSEMMLEKRGILTGTSEVNPSEKQEASSATEQSEESPSTKAVTTGSFPNGSTATWNFDDTTGTLTISGGTLVNPSTSIQDLTGIPVSEITNIVLEDKVIASGDCSLLFYAQVMTSLDLRNLDTSQVTNMYAMFYYNAATSLDLSNFDTSSVTDMSCMFYYNAATSLELNNFNTSQVTDMSYMFTGSPATNLDVSSFDTSKVTTMREMFCYSAATSLDLSNFDTSNVTNMFLMFAGASQLQNLTLGSQFQFVGTDVNLPDPTPTADYTGKWQNVGSGTVDRPKGLFVGTATELMTQYDGSTMADTYVWQPVLAPVVVNVKDSTLMQGDTWNASDNFLGATDDAGASVSFQDITVSGSVDTTQSGVYPVTYTYGGVTSTATITVFETMPESWINFIVDGTNVRSIPGTALSTPKWNLTTGLWTGWNPGTIKVPTDKIPSELTKQGYVFKGWKDTAGTIVDFNTLDLDLNSQHEFNFYAVFEKVNSTNPSVEPPTKPGEGPNVVSPATPGSGGNQTPSNGSGLNVGNTAITSQGNTSPTSPAASQGGKLAKLGENSSLLLQGFGLLLVLSGMIFFWKKRKKTQLE
ncbi:BspA family leucine-rich repeat surface protein [Listeria monocytogenes]|nr:BspA family leucine-rich repeat surface protein [Listeria monocytogenes]EHO7443017.1 BspA family leucine-rich repeat surface protein [Listeria monocytogenes]EHO9271267.1 BspA family leucine-rich repeat surface protein [Listeria monocytogenes]EJO6566189.1 BspA family leucine-rich repeat surface protein [Listeria monocytogenes]